MHTGTVSHGTMREEDLIPTFLSRLDVIGKSNKAARRAYERISKDVADGETEYALEDLFDALDYAAPKGYCFGAHEGDGSDYGFWPIIEE